MYCEVKDNEIIRYNIERPKAYKNISFGSNATDNDFRQVGLYPIVDSLPEYNSATQKIDGVTYSFDGNQVNKVYQIADIDISYLLQAKLDQLAALRYEKETAGIEVNGSRIRTDRETQSILDSAQRKAESNPDLVVDWKGENGWVELTSPQIIAIGSAVFDHVQACFKRERELSELLDIDIETDITTGWPV